MEKVTRKTGFEVTLTTSEISRMDLGYQTLRTLILSNKIILSIDLMRLKDELRNHV